MVTTFRRFTAAALGVMLLTACAVTACSGLFPLVACAAETGYVDPHDPRIVIQDPDHLGPIRIEEQAVMQEIELTMNGGRVYMPHQRTRGVWVASPRDRNTNEGSVSCAGDQISVGLVFYTVKGDNAKAFQKVGLGDLKLVKQWNSAGKVFGYTSDAVRWHTNSHAGLPMKVRRGWYAEYSVPVPTWDPSVVKQIPVTENERATDIVVLYPDYLMYVRSSNPTNDMDVNYAAAMDLLALAHRTMVKHGLAAPNAPEVIPARGNFSVYLTTSRNDEVVNARADFGDTRTRRDYQIQTNGSGHANLSSIDIADSALGTSMRMQRILLNQNTSFGGRPSRIAGNIELICETDNLLKADGDFRSTLDYRLELRPLYVTLQRGDDPNAPPPTAPTVVSLFKDDYDEGLIMRSLPADLSTAAPGQLTLYVPTWDQTGMFEFHITARCAIGGVLFVGWQTIRAPRVDESSAAVIIDLYPDDVAGQISRVKPQMAAFLRRSGFSDEEIARCLGFRVEVTASGTNRYNDGTITFRQGTSLGSSAETVCHEIGHAIVDALAPDNPDGVGEVHEGTGATNPELAWDEGRADLFAYFLTREIDVKHSVPYRGSPEGYADTASREDFVCEALVDHYGDRQLYATNAEALADFMKIHDIAQDMFGRPPRTMLEFLAAKISDPDISADRRDDILLNVQGHYNF